MHFPLTRLQRSVFLYYFFFLLLAAVGGYFIFSIAPSATFFQRSLLLALYGILLLFSLFLVEIYLRAKEVSWINSMIKNLLGEEKQDPFLLATICQKRAFALVSPHEIHLSFGKKGHFALSRRFLPRCLDRCIYVAKEQWLLAATNYLASPLRDRPTDLELHTSLASTYVALSNLYREWLNRKALSLLSPLLEEKLYLHQRSEKATKAALAELTIMSNFAPNDPWIHTQLALSYQDLGMVQEEIHHYLLVHQLLPSDLQILYRLGALYFREGNNAQGLRCYEKLKGSNPKLARKLIDHYAVAFS